MKTTTRTLFGAAALAAAAAAVACYPSAQECGPGTRQSNGTCVVLTDEVRCGAGTALDVDTGECGAIVVCGDGTELDEVTGTCLPASECGPGTFFDLAKAECAPEQYCGPGTSFDEEVGECTPAVWCGAGTYDDGAGSCLPDEPCQDGSVRDEATGLCVSDLSCGAGQVVVAAQCVDPAGGLALQADAVESFPDVNDPTTGGLPETFSLEPTGERAIFVGTIGRPADLAGNGTLTQDQDAWRFEGVAGQYLRIAVHDAGLPQPAFVLDGPEDYRRTSAVGLGSVATRDVVLPFDGAYTLTVVPSAWLASGVPLGDPEAGYVAVVEEVVFPAQSAVVPGATAQSPATISGNLLDIDDNLLNVQVTPGTAFAVSFSSVGESVVPAALALDAGLSLLGHVQGLEEGGWMGVFVATGSRATVVLDWQEATGIDDAFTVDVFEVPLIDRGDVPSDFHTVTAAHPLVAGNTTAAFSFAVDADQVAIADLGGTGVFNPDVQVTGPGGTRADIRDDDDFFFFVDAGRYVVFVNNDGTSDDENVSLQLQLRTPHDLGHLAVGDVSQVAGDDLVYGFGGFPDAWAVASLADPGLLEIEVEASHGDPDLYVYSKSGELLRALHRPHLGKPTAALIGDSRPVLVRLDADDHNLLGWSLAARAAALPTSFDVEPNDTRAHAISLGVAPVRTSGLIDDDEIDVYRFELDAPPAAGQAIRVVVDNLAGDSTFSSVTDGAIVLVRDASFQPLASIPETASTPGMLGPTTATLIPGFEGAGPFYVQIEGKHISEPSVYLLDIGLVELTSEVEPNDDVADADAVGALPASLFGYRGGDGGQDLWKVQLDAPLGANESLRVAAKNLENNNSLTLTLEDELGNVRLGVSRVLGELAVPGLSAGTHYVRVEGGTSSDSPYRLDVSIGGAAEREPNNTPFSLQDLGVVSSAPFELTGYAGSGDDDIFAFTLDAPLGADEGLRVELINVDDGSKNVVELFDASGSAPVLVGHDEGVYGELVAGDAGSVGPFGLRVAGAGATLDRYVLRLSRSGRAESEPNDDPTTASAAVVGGRVMGTVSGGEVDVFAVTLSQPLPAGKSLVAHLENESDGTSIRLALHGTTFGDVLSEGTGFRVFASAASLSAGTYFFEVEGTGAVTSVSDVYSVELGVQ